MTDFRCTHVIGLFCVSRRGTEVNRVPVARKGSEELVGSPVLQDLWGAEASQEMGDLRGSRGLLGHL